MAILGVVVGILILSIMMIVHELGHFLAGKALGFKIVSYNIFMGPILWQKRGKDGVLYTVRCLPVGASVEFAGEDTGINDDPEKDNSLEPYASDDPGLFSNRPRWARAIVIFMGPFINFATALLAFIIAYNAFGVTLPVIQTVQPGSPAQEAGLEEGDRIVSLNGYPVSTALDVTVSTQFSRSLVTEYAVIHSDGRRETLQISRKTQKQYRLGISYVPRADGRMIVGAVSPESNEGNPVLFPGDELLSVNGIPVTSQEAFQAAVSSGKSEVTLELIREGEKKTVMTKTSLIDMPVPVGLSFASAQHWTESTQQAFLMPGAIIRSTVKGLEWIISGLIPAKEGLTGPIGIVNLVGTVVQEEIDWQQKINQLLLLFGMISVAVGFTNLLPIPPFDGFQLVVLGIEGIRRKDLSRKLKERLAMLGVGILIILVGIVFYMDISRLFRG